MSREIHAGTALGLPSFSSIRSAMMLPFGASPLVIGNFTPLAAAPEAGTYSQRAFFSSSAVAIAPQNPLPAKSASSLTRTGLR